MAGTREKVLTDLVVSASVSCPMARIHTADQMLQGQSLSSFGALTCLPDLYPNHRDKRERRELADTGMPVERW